VYSSSSARATHTLKHACRGRLRVKAHDQVDLANIESLLADGRAHERVVTASLEVAHDLELLLLRQTLAARRALADKAHGLDHVRGPLEAFHNLLDRVAILRKDHHTCRLRRLVAAKVIVHHVDQLVHLGVPLEVGPRHLVEKISIRNL